MHNLLEISSCGVEKQISMVLLDLIGCESRRQKRENEQCI